MLSVCQTALSSAALLTLALSLTLATSLKAECFPPGGGYRYTYAGIDRFNGVRTTRTHLPPDYGPAVPNLYAFAGDKDAVFALIFTSLGDTTRYTRCSTVFILADGKPLTTHGGSFTGGTGIESSGLEVQNGLQAAALAYGKAHPQHLMYHLFFAETVTAQLNASAVAQLGTASKIEFKICNDEVKASAEFVLAAHEFACRVGEHQDSATPNAAPSGLCPAQVIDRLK